MPSASLSRSNLFGVPSPSVSHVSDEGEQTAFSTVSRIPSLSSSRSSSSANPSPSKSGMITNVIAAARLEQPFTLATTERVPPIAPAVSVMLLVVEVPTQPVGVDHV